MCGLPKAFLNAHFDGSDANDLFCRQLLVNFMNQIPRQLFGRGVGDGEKQNIPCRESELILLVAHDDGLASRFDRETIALGRKDELFVELFAQTSRNSFNDSEIDNVALRPKLPGNRDGHPIIVTVQPFTETRICDEVSSRKFQVILADEDMKGLVTCHSSHGLERSC